MAWNYRKRITVAPRVHLNVSKKGVSTTFGVRGASITSGKNGAYLNTGIPGTGIYNRQRIGGTSKNLHYKPNKGKPKHNGCGIITVIFLVIGLIVILTDTFENTGLIFVGCAFAGAIIDCIVNFIIDEVKKNNVTEETIIEDIDIDSDIDSELTEIEKERFSDLCQKFSDLLSCNKIWFVTSLGTNARRSEIIDRKEIAFSTGNLNSLKTSFKIPIIKDLYGTKYYICPKFIIKANNSQEFEQIPIETINVNFQTRRFIEDLSPKRHTAQLLNEPFSDLPKDTKIVDYEFKYTNKDGSPDLRYSFNPKLPVVEYGRIEIYNFELIYYISNIEKAQRFVDAFDCYKKTNATEYINQEKEKTCQLSQLINEGYFNLVYNSVNLLIEFYDFLRNDRIFITKIKEQVKIPNVLIEQFDELRMLFMLDILKCYKKFNYSKNLISKEGFGVLIFTNRLLYSKTLLQFNDLYLAENIFEETKKFIASFDELAHYKSETNFDNNFLLSTLLSEYDVDLQKKYLVMLYRFASIIAKADSEISETEQKWLSELLKMSEGTDIKEEKTVEKAEKPKIKSLPKSDSQTELNVLIGLNSVKKEISTLANFLKIQKQREEKGLKSSQLSYHCVFTGNPGTGKTTVARIVAEIYKELGILQKGHLVETDRSGLVAEYVGQTAVKTNKIIDSSLDGVLFIDEAYSLVSGGENDYGKEAIATLLKRMEDNRDRLVVILAGYTTEMQEFINSNSGLQSRFNRYIDFPDYSAEELYQIFELNLKKFDYTISEDAAEKLKNYFKNIVTKKDTNFGNARFVRNFFEKTLEQQANRLSSETNLTTEKLSEISPLDIAL
jgi:SpoVK/Ycf46/Vps4 family AAA+-type ATPase